MSTRSCPWKDGIPCSFGRKTIEWASIGGFLKQFVLHHIWAQLRENVSHVILRLAEMRCETNKECLKNRPHMFSMSRSKTTWGTSSGSPSSATASTTATRRSAPTTSPAPVEPWTDANYTWRFRCWVWWIGLKSNFRTIHVTSQHNNTVETGYKVTAYRVKSAIKLSFHKPQLLF